MTINRILKGLSKATIAVALLGGVATTNSNQPLTVQAAKKKAKKVSKKKAAKKSKKKVTKKSKKKVVKKTTKKKVAKKVTKKKPKKAVKKVVKKPAKKVVKKPSKPKTTVKKSTQKPASTPSQPAKQVVKKTTQANRYTPASSSAASSSSSSQTQRYSDEEYAAAYWFSGNGVTFSEDSIFWHSPTISNLYLYQPSKTTGNVTHLTVNANDIYIEFDVNPAHPHGLSHETVTKDSLNFILSQRKDDIDDYISEQASSPDNPNNQ